MTDTNNTTAPDAANRLYDNTPNEAVPKTDNGRIGTIVTGNALASKPVVSNAQGKPSGGEPVAHQLYDAADGLEAAFVESTEKLRVHLGMSPEEIRSVQQEHAAFFREFDVPITEAKYLHSMLTTAMIKPAGEETVKEWTIESRRLAIETYGDDYEKLLPRAQEMIRGNPQLAKLLRESGYGSNPRLVLAVLEGARRKGR